MLQEFQWLLKISLKLCLFFHPPLKTLLPFYLIICPGYTESYQFKANFYFAKRLMNM